MEARTAIQAGEEITVQYYRSDGENTEKMRAITRDIIFSSLLGTHKRRRRLRSEWYFDCECAR